MATLGLCQSSIARRRIRCSTRLFQCARKGRPPPNNWGIGAIDSPIHLSLLGTERTTAKHSMCHPGTTVTPKFPPNVLARLEGERTADMPLNFCCNDGTLVLASNNRPTAALPHKVQRLPIFHVPTAPYGVIHPGMPRTLPTLR